MRFIILLLFVFACVSPPASKKRSERDYQKAWCLPRGGKIEHVLPDRTRVDCLLRKQGYAIEFDFAKKWAEAPFQALHYARMTGTRPGVVLICQKPSDVKFLKRLRENISFVSLKIRLWSINCG